MKKMIFVILMCVAKMATAQEISPLVPYKPGKSNHSIIEMEKLLKGNPSIVKNWGAVIERAAWRDGWAHEVSPEFFQEERYILFCLRKSFQVKKNFKKGDFATFGTKSDGELASTERDPYSGELFLELDPNDLETENFRLSQDYPPFVYASSVCMNGVDVYARQVSSSDVSPTPRLNRNNEGYAQVPPSNEVQKYAEPEFTESGNNYSGSESEKVIYEHEQGEGVQYEEPKTQFQFSVGILFGASDGCWSHNNGCCNHGYSYQRFGYQPQGYTQPVVTNTDVYVNVINNNTNINTTTVTTNPGNPHGGPGPTDPHTSGPIDPSTKNWFVNNPPPRPMKTDRGVFAGSSTVQSDPRPFNPSQKSPNYFMRDPRQDQSHASQTPQSRPTTKQNQTQTNGYSQSRPQERSNYNQNPRGSNPQQARTSQLSSRPSYGNSSPTRQTAYNAPSRGSAPSGGRANSGGSNSGRRSR